MIKEVEVEFWQRAIKLDALTIGSGKDRKKEGGKATVMLSPTPNVPPAVTVNFKTARLDDLR
jgi:hypothetical protein